MQTTLTFTIEKRTVIHDDREGIYPSLSIGFQGEALTARDKQRLIKTLVDDLVRKIEDRDKE